MTDVRLLPGVPDRVETGVVQFGDDWPGVFIRGDNAMHFALQLKDVLETFSSADRGSPLYLNVSVLRGLVWLLASVDISGVTRKHLQLNNERD